MGEGVKSFFGGDSAVSEVDVTPAVPAVAASSGDASARTPLWSARIAVYDAPAAAPRTEEVRGGSEADLIEQIASRVFAYARDAGGRIPYTVIREVAENFIHAEFREPVVSILESGETIRFADQGPGIVDKQRAVLPGFTTATGAMKGVIRGVGSGLPIVNDYLSVSGGALDIDDNLGYGTVVTIRSGHREPEQPLVSPPAPEAPGDPQPSAFAGYPPLSTRQKQVLSLVLELGEVGPTIVSNELAVALSTAYRDLAYLEHNGLIQSDASGKRVLTPEGSSYLDSLFAQ